MPRNIGGADVSFRGAYPLSSSTNSEQSDVSEAESTEVGVDSEADLTVSPDVSMSEREETEASTETSTEESDASDSDTALETETEEDSVSESGDDDTLFHMKVLAKPKHKMAKGDSEEKRKRVTDASLFWMNGTLYRFEILLDGDKVSLSQDELLQARDQIKSDFRKLDRYDKTFHRLKDGFSTATINYTHDTVKYTTAEGKNHEIEGKKKKELRKTFKVGRRFFKENFDLKALPRRKEKEKKDKDNKSISIEDAVRRLKNKHHALEKSDVDYCLDSVKRKTNKKKGGYLDKIPKPFKKKKKKPVLFEYQPTLSYEEFQSKNRIDATLLANLTSDLDQKEKNRQLHSLQVYLDGQYVFVTLNYQKKKLYYYDSTGSQKRYKENFDKPLTSLKSKLGKEWKIQTNKLKNGNVKSSDSNSAIQGINCIENQLNGGSFQEYRTSDLDVDAKRDQLAEELDLEIHPPQQKGIVDKLQFWK